jgi:Acetyltransferase (GNAT) domain
MTGSTHSTACGYRHPAYATSFADIATAREMPCCGGWILERTIPGTDLLDGMGCYPIFACRDWDGLPRDLPPLADRLVSLTLVTDPFGAFTEGTLRDSFDVILPYKQHYVTDLDLPVSRLTSVRHRRNTARALRGVRVETCPEPLDMLPEWIALYDYLVARHGITGIRAFSRAAFAVQLAVPGMMMFKAVSNDAVVGLHLWYIDGEVAYGHLGATSASGYELMASYALYQYAIEQLRGRVRWLDLGSSAGSVAAESGSGLRAFKAGWSTGTRPTYLCGRIFQPDRYARLVAERRVGPTSYFPAYRRGEFGAVVEARAGETPRLGAKDDV